MVKDVRHLRYDTFDTKLVTDGTGAGNAKFPIPNEPAIAGIDLFVQGAIIEPSASEGWRLSSGLETVICN